MKAIGALWAFLKDGLFPLLYFGVAVHAFVALAQSPGTFTATGKMITPRYSHTATLLANGKILITGGCSSWADSAVPAEASAELYDPVTGTFTATGSMTKHRDGHTATLLPNGTVLIAGGGSIYGGASYPEALVSAELYDPSTGMFAATGDMMTSRREHTAILLNTGKVLIAGGRNPGNVLTSAELYDPSTGNFASTGDMTEPLADTATLLPNGRVFMTTGGDPDNFVGHTEIYDPSTGTFAPSGDTTEVHIWPTSTLLMNGKVLIAGGRDGTDFGGASGSAELYDPADGTFAATRNLSTARVWNSTTLLPDGTVLFAGGHSCPPSCGSGDNNLASAEIYNPVMGAFSAVGDMITSRDSHSATLLASGKVLITGGKEYYPCCANGRDPHHPEVALAELYTSLKLVPAPALFSLPGDARGQGAIWHAETGQVASSQNPAIAGEVLSMYTTSLVDGSMIPPQVSIGGRLGEILFFGGAPGYPGFNQVNVRVPSGVAPGSAVPVHLTYLGRPSNEVTIGVR